MRYLAVATTAVMLAGMGVSNTLNAKGLVPLSSISSATALAAASAAKESCSKMGFHVSVTVVDAAGNVLATLRDDGAGPHTAIASHRKAYTALTTRMPTSQMVKIVGASPEAFGLRQIEGLLILSGGLPIKAGDSVVGAIGVSGAPGPESDEKCGSAGIASIADALDGK